MKRIKGDARGELATGPYYSPGDCRVAGEGWSDRKEPLSEAYTNYWGRHPDDPRTSDDGPRRFSNIRRGNGSGGYE